VRGLNGKVAVVAGGAGGIGTATSIRLAEEGARVVVGDLNEQSARGVAEEIARRGGTAVAIPFDIGVEEDVAGLVATAVDEFGGVDILHANAADLSPATIGLDSDATQIALEVFDRTMHVNMRGHLLCARHGIPELLKRGGGAVVFTSSAAAFAGEPERPAYAMAKSAINALVRHIASRWGKEGIRANAVAPGLVLTESVRDSLNAEFRDQVLGMSRSPRLGAPEDIAAMVAFLASGDGEWINGQVFNVDGGAILR
jgi:NAD(P)-dependent dehydrogenase (short-subunit alcohol dehydrogenase family)